MASLTEEEFQSVTDLVRSTGPIAAKVINSYSSSAGPYRALLKSTNAKDVVISKDAREFQFSEPCYITRIDVAGDDLANLSLSLSITAIKLDGTRVELKSRSVTQTNQDGSTTQLVSYDATSPRF